MLALNQIFCTFKFSHDFNPSTLSGVLFFFLNMTIEYVSTPGRLLVFFPVFIMPVKVCRWLVITKNQS